jgi:hypothetical protein
MTAIIAQSGVASANSSPTDPPPTGNKITATHFTGLRDFVRGSWDNVMPSRGNAMAISPFTRKTVSYTDPFGDGTARTYDYGSWTTPVVKLGYGGDEAIASWNATTPTGTWVETTFRGQHADGTWTKWYVLGRWTSGNNFADGDIHRTSLDGQGDTDANVYTDTFSARTGRTVTAYQTKVTLLRPHGSHATPTLSGLTVMTSEVQPDYTGTSTFTLGKQVELKVPAYAQNIHKGEYPDFGGGGEVWCSPTSTTMAQYYWGRKYQVPTADLAGIDAPNGDPQVDYAAIHAWDYQYDGSGNWPFNAAYAHEFGLSTFVTRLRSLAEVEKFIKAGIPVVVSLSWTLDEMPEAGYDTDGHLMVIVGFTKDGDPILNDPASNSNDNVRSIYTRTNFEKVWQESTNGIAYIYHPKNVKLPPHVKGATPNW